MADALLDDFETEQGAWRRASMRKIKLHGFGEGFEHFGFTHCARLILCESTGKTFRLDPTRHAGHRGFARERCRSFAFGLQFFDIFQLFFLDGTILVQSVTSCNLI